MVEEEEEEEETAPVETSTHQSIPISSASSKFFDDVGIMPCARSILDSTSTHSYPPNLAAHSHWNVIKHRLCQPLLHTAVDVALVKVSAQETYLTKCYKKTLRQACDQTVTKRH
jgi:hypothetical protein